MTTCPACGSTKVVFVPPFKGGYTVLMNLGAPHRLTCKAGPGRKQPDELVNALKGQGYTPMEAKRLAQAARLASPKGADMETLLRAALKARGAEL